MYQSIESYHACAEDCSARVSMQQGQRSNVNFPRLCTPASEYCDIDVFKCHKPRKTQNQYILIISTDILLCKVSIKRVTPSLQRPAYAEVRESGGRCRNMITFLDHPDTRVKTFSGKDKQMYSRNLFLRLPIPSLDLLATEHCSN